MIDDAIVARARAAADEIAPLGDRIEIDRRLPPAAVDALVRAGVFKLFVPARYGGSEAHPVTVLAAIEAIARADGSAGWCTMVGATSGLMSIHLEESTAQEIFGPKDAIVCGVVAPMGLAVREADGYRVSGRWPFASACEIAQWRMGGVVVGPVREGEAPATRCVLFRAEETRVVDTWRTGGLRGTGSHDLTVEDVVVPEARTFSLIGRPKHEGYTLPFFGALAGCVAAVGLGIARGAIDAFVVLAKGKTSLGAKRSLAHREGIQADVAKAEAKVAAGRAFLFDAMTAATKDPTVAARARLRLAAAHAAEEAEAATAIVYRAGGGSAIYATSPLERRFRDAHVVTHHVMVGATATTMAGRILLGVETDVAML